MALDIYHVHTMVHDPRTDQMILTASRPYKRFSAEGESPISVQDGRFYFDEGGSAIPLEDVPDWVKKQVRQTDASYLERLGLQPDWDRVAPVDREPITPEPEVEEITEIDALTLEDAIFTLDHNEVSHWNQSGKPDLNHLREVMGHYISRPQVEAAAPGLVRKEV